MKQSNNVGAALNFSNSITQRGVLQKNVVSGTHGVRRKSPDAYTVYIPENVDLGQLLESNPLNIPNAKDYLAVLMHKIHSVIAFKKDVDFNEQDGYTILNSSILKQWCDNYAPLMQWHVERGIVECNNSYSNFEGREISKGYRFAESYRTKLAPYIVSLQALVKKLKGTKRLKKHKKGVLKPGNLISIYPDINTDVSYSSSVENELHYLKAPFNPNLKIDTEKSEVLLNQLLMNDIENPDKKFPFTNYNCRKMIVDSIANRQFYFHIDETTGRLHTNLTNLKSELRNYLSYNDKRLASIDLVNSQPLLSISFLDEKLFKRNKMDERLMIYNESKGIESENLFSHITMLRDLIHKRQNCEDVLLYKHLVQKGSIYEYFAEQMINHSMMPDSLDEKRRRKEAKKIMFLTLFSKNKLINNKKYGRFIRLFRKCFPNVLEIFFCIKHYNHTALACSLQNLESELFLHQISKECHELYPTLPLFTIHDSIATIEDEISNLMPIVIKRLKNAIGLEPETKIEYWNDDMPLNNVQQNTTGLYGYIDPEFHKECYSLKEAGNYFGMGRNKFSCWLREKGLLGMEDYRRNKPSDELIDSGIFVVKKKNLKSNRVIYTSLITRKGMEYLKGIID